MQTKLDQEFIANTPVNARNEMSAVLKSWKDGVTTIDEFERDAKRCIRSHAPKTHKFGTVATTQQEKDELELILNSRCQDEDLVKAPRSVVEIFFDQCAVEVDCLLDIFYMTMVEMKVAEFVSCVSLRQKDLDQYILLRKEWSKLGGGVKSKTTSYIQRKTKVIQAYKEYHANKNSV